MTRAEALHKVIALEPINKRLLEQVCGWSPDEFERLLKGLIRAGVVTYHNVGGHQYVRAAQ